MKNMLNEMLNMQDKFNESVITNWKVANLDWNTAIYSESNEAIDSLDWKWWKKGSVNQQNYEVELIDIWHFIMGQLIPTSSNNDNIILLINNAINDSLSVNVIPLADNTQYHIDQLKKLSFQSYNGTYLSMVKSFFKIWFSLGKDVKDLFYQYIAKNCLNEFRQNNGYKTGEYIKLWNITDNNLIEDNEAVDSIIKNNFTKSTKAIDASKMYSKLYDLINREYKQMKNKYH